MQEAVCQKGDAVPCNNALLISRRIFIECEQVVRSPHTQCWTSYDLEVHLYSGATVTAVTWPCQSNSSPSTLPSIYPID